MRPPSLAPSVLRLLRPNQLSKNLLVLGAPFAAGQLHHPAVIGRGLLATVAFALAASAVYAANDVVDVEDDRRHPTKRSRPVASGLVTSRMALAVSATCATLALVAATLLGPLTLLVVFTYLATSAAYVLRLRSVPVLDIVTVSVGFVLRALAGAAATSLAVSDWFLLVALFGSLFLVCAKRRAELNARRPGPSQRLALRAYSSGWLDQVVTLSLSGTALAYATWAFQVHDVQLVRAVLAISVLPVLVALLRYLLLVDLGEGERPESLIRDRLLIGCALGWAALVACGLYVI